MEKIEFCKSNLSDKMRELCKLIIPDINIQDFYDFWKNNFDKEIDFNQTLFALQKNKIHDDLKLKYDISLNHFGIDFPTWFNFDQDKKRKKIMIIGRDPQRNKSNYANNRIIGDYIDR